MAHTNRERFSADDSRHEEEVDSSMNELLSATTLWCSCSQDAPQYELVEEDWHGEHIKMKCSHCGHTVYVERSLISPMREQIKDSASQSDRKSL